MAWTTPRTWSTGELVDATTLNTHVRDNLAYLKANPVIAETSTTTSAQANNATVEVLAIATAVIPADVGAVYCEAWGRGLGFSNPPGSGSYKAFRGYISDSVAGEVAAAGADGDTDFGQTDTGNTDQWEIGSFYIRSVDLAWAGTTRTVRLYLSGSGCIGRMLAGSTSPIVLRVVRSY